ncbi:MAG: DUF2157 domain-containing protein [Clostridiales bacterium]|jgi:uncharacterized membrane protein|nr:DUF2157 domain-containing protein [Clostridiales bacterium]
MKDFFVPNEEITNLLASGIIDQETATKMEMYYSKIKVRKNNESSRTSSMMFAIIGALLIGLGVIVFASINWHSFSVATKTVISLLPLILSSCGAIYIVGNRIDSQNFKEITAILYSASVFTAVALISRIFHVDNHSYFLTCGILTLPMIYLLDSISLVPIYIATVLSSYSAIEYKSIVEQNIWFTIELLLIAPRIIHLLKLNASHRLNKFLGSVSFVGIFIYTFILSFNNNQIIMDFIYLVPLLLLAVSIILQYYKNEFFASILKWSIASLLVITYLCTFKGFGDSFFATINYATAERVPVGGQWAALIVLGLITIALATIASYKNDSKYFRVTIIAFSLLFLSSLAGKIIIPMLIANGVVLIIGAMRIYFGMIDGNFKNMNSGMFLVCLIILTRFFDSNFALGIKALVFILVGCVFLGVNIYAKKNQRLNKGENRFE